MAEAEKRTTEQENRTDRCYAARIGASFCQFSARDVVQTQDRTYRIAAPSDHSVLKTFEALAALVEDGSFWVVIAGVRTSDQTTAAEFAQLVEGNWNRTRIIAKAGCALGDFGFQVIFQRAITNWDTNGHARVSPAAWENEIYLSWRSDRGEPDETLRLEVAQLIAGFQKGDLKPAAAMDSFSEAMAAQVARLAELQASIMEDADLKRRSQEDAFIARRAELEAEHAALVAQLNASSVEAKERVASEAARLETRRKELDDRGHMHARRELRGEITKDLKARLERPGVSRQANILRWGVVFTAFIGIVLFGWVAAVSITDLHALYRSANPDPIVLGFASLRFALPAGAAAALLFYVLGWLRKLHSEDVNSERDLERYRYDLDRASWAIETILEAQGKEGGTVPAEWISGVTHGLFSRSSSSNEDRDAADALGSLLNFAAKAEFGPNGPKIEFQKRDLRRLSREAAES